MNRSLAAKRLPVQATPGQKSAKRASTRANKSIVATSTAKEAVASLARLQEFGGLSATARTILEQGLLVRAAEPNNAVLHKGQPVSGAYLVLKGRLRVFSIAPNGTEATLYFVDPGEACVLALNCLFNDLLYPAWVQAETHSEIAVIPGPVFRRLFESERPIQNLTIHALSALVYRLMAELEQLHASNHKQRLVQFILLHANSDGVLQMTQQHIARHLGTTREVIARIMQEFVGRRLVVSRRGSITVRDLFGLRRVMSEAK